MPTMPDPRPGIDSPFLILVTGGRDYPDRDAVWRALDALHRKHSNITVLHGMCPTGADAFAEEWAKLNGRPYIGDPRGSICLIAYLPHGCVSFGADSVATAEAETAGVAVWRP